MVETEFIRRDSGPIFDWLMTLVALQGISDDVAFGWDERHGGVRWAEVDEALRARPSCPRLQSYWHFHGCGYRKGTGVCAEPGHLPRCPLPRLKLRKGGLNQSAFHLALFVRDVCRRDLVAWLDARLAQADPGLGAPDRAAALGRAVTTPLALQGISDDVAFGWDERHGGVRWAEVDEALRARPSCPRLQSYWHFHGCGYRKGTGVCADPDTSHAAPWRGSTRGIGPKLWPMMLGELLIVGDPGRERWVVAGAGMIAVDSLVHNWLHRTGTLRRCGAEHAYGPACFAPGGCADILRAFADTVDARQFNPAFPRCFPRFVQHAIWRFCATGGLDVCNGNRVDDREPCRLRFCPAGPVCDRVPLRSAPLA